MEQNMEMEKSNGWVYVLTNEAMPGLVKVGCTTRTPEIRAKELFEETAGVPAPFVVIYAAYTPEHKESEELVHLTLKREKRHYNKEFFKCDPSVAIECIKENVDIRYEQHDEKYIELIKYETGEIKWKSGTYTGDYKVNRNGNKLPHGQGTWTKKFIVDEDDRDNYNNPESLDDADDYVRAGEWRHGRMNGWGTYTIPREKFSHHFSDLNLKESGENCVLKYAGNFCNHHCHGKIEITNVEGKVSEHLFEHGKDITGRIRTEKHFDANLKGYISIQEAMTRPLAT